LMPDDAAVLTIEFKTNLVAPARGDHFLSRACVLKPAEPSPCATRSICIRGRD
jgi:hypothetical protein